VTRSAIVIGCRGGQSASSEASRSTLLLSLVIVAIRRVFVDPSPELFSAHAHVRRRCDQLLEERATALFVILKTGVGRNEFHGRCLLVLTAQCARSCRNRRRCRSGEIPFLWKGQLTRLHDLASPFLVALHRPTDLLLCAKDLFVAARTMGFSHHAASGNHLEFRRRQITSRPCTRCSSQTLDVPLVGAAGQLPVGASQCHSQRRYGTSRFNLGQRWPSRLVATTTENRLSFPSKARAVSDRERRRSRRTRS